MAPDKKITPEAIRAQLDRILQSAEFRGSDKQKGFLRFVVDETLEGHASQLKGYTIAVAVYGRAGGFDPQVDPIVRVEAGRLRRTLEHYYLTAGKNDPVRIGIPKGGYVPTFEAVQAQPPKDETLTLERDRSESYSGPSVAIMPLLNLTADEEQDYFCDGITEELTAELTRYQEFRVIASQSTTRFKGRKVDPKGIGRDLGVQFLLAGSIRKYKKAVKVNMELLDTHTSAQIWGESYKRDLTAANLIAVQEEIAHRVAGAIADQYGSITRRLSSESRKKAPADLMAYDAILRFYHYETVLTPDAFKEALEGLEQAVETEPGYGLAWAMLGHLHADNHAIEFCKIDSSLEKALMFAQKAVALDPESQFVQDALTLVHFHRGDKEMFLKHAEQTIALNPNAPYVVGVAGWHLALFGEWERGLALLKKGIQLNPYYPRWFHLARYMDYYRRSEYENAFAEALKFNYPEFFWYPVMRAAALGEMGREGDARAAVDELLKLVPDFATCGRELIRGYVKVEDVVDAVVEGLQKAGLDDLE
jgi:adenylate cyclase